MCCRDDTKCWVMGWTNLWRQVTNLAPTWFQFFSYFRVAFGEIKPLISLSVTPAIDCNQPTVVNAASVLLTSPGMTTLFSSTAAVTCKTGFSANGVSGTITCDENRNWKGISCIGEMIKLIRRINFLLLGLTKEVTQHFLCGTC